MVELKSIKLQRIHVALISSILVIIALIFFGYFYMLRTNPFETAKLPDGDQDLPVRKFFINGPPENSLKRTLGVAFNNDNKQIVVADSGNNRIALFDTNGKFINTFGKLGTGDGEFNYPTSVAVSSQGEIYVADFNNHRIQVFSKEGKYSRKITQENSGTTPFAPVAITMDNQDQLYVSNLGKQEICTYDARGKLKSSFGKPGSKDGEISYVNGLSVDDKNGWIYLADSNNGRVQIFTLEGRLIKKLDRNLGFAVPRGILFDQASERLYVVDTLLHQVKVFNSALKPIGFIGSMGQGYGEFSFPNAIAKDDRGNLYIADRENNRIVVYSYQ